MSIMKNTYELWIAGCMIETGLQSLEEAKVFARDFVEAGFACTIECRLESKDGMNNSSFVSAFQSDKDQWTPRYTLESSQKIYDKC